MKLKITILFISLSILTLAQIQTFEHGGNFTGTVIVPEGTQDNHAVNKGQMDAAIGGGGPGGLTLGNGPTNAWYGDKGKLADDYRLVGHLPLTGGTLAGNLNFTTLIISEVGVTKLRTSTTSTVLSASGGAIQLRPNGDASSTGQITITNTGQINTPSNGTSNQWNIAYGWGNHAGLYIGLTGNQTISGTKTFSNQVIVPDGTSTNHAINKGQLDAASWQNGLIIYTLSSDAVWSGNGSILLNLNSTIDESVWTSSFGWEIWWNDGASATSYKRSLEHYLGKGVELNSGNRTSSGGFSLSLNTTSFTIPAGAKLIIKKLP